jgi:hypothetical protein
VANNLFVLPAGNSLFKGSEGDRYRWLGNVAWWEGPPASGLHDGVVCYNPLLERGSSGPWRPRAESPIRQRADNNVKVKTDMDGQRRPRRADVGADQVSERGIVFRPLKPLDVGPAWMTER